MAMRKTVLMESFMVSGEWKVNLDICLLWMSLGCFELWLLDGDQKSSERGDQTVFIDKACQAFYSFSTFRPPF